MVGTICILACALTTAQPPARGDWLLTPQLVRGQELVYRGTFSEEALSPGVQFKRSYDVETWILVLDNVERKKELAVLTILSQPGPAPKAGAAPARTISSVRLELADLHPQGQVKGKTGSLLMPLDGPPTIEVGCFVEVPKTAMGRDQLWEVNEEGRPPHAWKIIGTEIVNGISCVKLSGVQKSEDWERPRADHAGWLRRDTVWFSTVKGRVERVERIVERRDPARKEPTHRSILRYDLESPLTFHGQLFDDRRLEIEEARRIHDSAQAILKQPTKQTAQIDQLLKKVATHMDHFAPTPYRKAIVQVQRRLEAAKRGDNPAVVASEDPLPEPTTVKIGQRVPDFAATELITSQSLRLYRKLGQPVLLFFYNPATETGVQALRFAQGVEERFRPRVTVLGLAVSDDGELVRKQHAEMKLAFGVLDGRGMHQTFGVDATPRLLVLDGDGILRAAYTGWGRHTPREVVEELQRWLVKRN